MLRISSGQHVSVDNIMILAYNFVYVGFLIINHNETQHW